MTNEVVILIVDDDSAVLEAMQLLLEGSFFRVLCAIGVESAQQFFADRQPIDVIVADVILSGDITGIDICRRAREIYPDVALVVTSADPDAENEAMPIDGVYLAKPFGGRQLLSAISHARKASRVPAA